MKIYDQYDQPIQKTPTCTNFWGKIHDQGISTENPVDEKLKESTLGKQT